MKNKYMTQREYDKNEEILSWIFVIALIVFFLAYFTWFDKTEDKPFREFVLSQYNFSEEECVEQVWVSCESFEMCAARTECSKYCRTEQKKVGEECVQDIANIIAVKYCNKNPSDIICVPKPEARIECTPIYENYTCPTCCADGNTVREARKLLEGG